MSAYDNASSYGKDNLSGLTAELQERNQRLKILSDIAGTLLLTDNPRDVIETVFEKLSAHLGLEAYFNYLLIEDGSRMRLANYRGIPPETAKEIEWLDFGQAVCGCVARDRARIIAEDVQHSGDERTDLIRSLGITAYCCHPLIANGKLIGTLSFGTRKRPAFRDDEIELLYVVCSQVAVAFERHGLIVQLQKSKDGLERKVGERTAELSVANTALNVTNEQLRKEIAERARAEARERKARYEADLYLDLMGHDISNMHQMSMSSIEMVLETADMSGDDRELLEKALETLHKSSRMIDSIRKLQAIRGGEIRQEKIDLGSTLHDTIAEYEKLTGRKIAANIADGDYPVNANRLLPEVFSSLLSNAIKHSRREDVAIAVSLGIEARDGMLYYRVSVEDNGPGIPDARKAEILGRFSQIEPDNRGIGTGLYVARSLIESYDGLVWAEDRVPGDHTQGARFVVMLPAAGTSSHQHRSGN